MSTGANEPTVALLHPGQMGAAVAATVVRAARRVLWCSDGRSPATMERAAAAGLQAMTDLAELVVASDVVLSICPPTAAEDVASEVAALGFGGIYVDANAISTDRVRRVAARMAHGGARFVDGAIIGPPPDHGRSVRLYLAGAQRDVAAVSDLFAGSPVECVALHGGAGSASALKMAYASYQKATRSLAAVAHALAARHGVTPQLLAEAERMAVSPLAEPDYLPSVAARAWRWSPEMHEVADSLAAQGLPTDLARAAAAVLDRWEPDRDVWDLTVPDVLHRLSGGHATPLDG